MLLGYTIIAIFTENIPTIQTWSKFSSQKIVYISGSIIDTFAYMFSAWDAWIFSIDHVGNAIFTVLCKVLITYKI